MMAASTSVEPIKITDVPINCLIEIFEHLKLPDLLNVADSNQQLNSVANFVFHRKYGRYKCYINVSELIPYECFTRFGFSDFPRRFQIGSTSSLSCKNMYARNLMYMSFPRKFPEMKRALNKYKPKIGINCNNIIKINDLFTSFRFLRCFGRCFGRIHIDCFGSINSDQQILKLFNYVNKYTSHYLIEFKITANTINIADPIRKPFKRVEKISLDFGIFEINHSRLNNWFPKMHHMKRLERKKLMFDDQIPKLESFDFCKSDYGADEREKSQLMMIANMNTQLKSFTIREYLDSEFIRLMSRKLHDIKELRFISIIPATTISHCDTNMNFVPLNSVLKFHMNVDRNLFKFFPPSFDQLEDFTVEEIEIDELRAFINKHNKITNSTIKRGNYNEKNILKIARTIPSLNTLDISEAKEHGFTIDNIRRFMAEIKPLNNFKVGVAPN